MNPYSYFFKRGRRQILA